MNDATEELFSLLLTNTTPVSAEEIVKLIAQGAEVNMRKKGWAPIHYAACNNHLAALQPLLSAGAELNTLLSTGGTWHNTILQIAAKNGNIIFMLALLAAGEKVEGKDTDGTTALHLAIDWNHQSAQKILLKAGASLRADRIEKLIWQDDDFLNRHFVDWEAKLTFVLRSGYTPRSYEEVMYMVSVMPVENDKAIPSPLERAKQLLDLMHDTPEANALYETVLGISRSMKQVRSLKEARLEAAQRGVGL